ncbi:MAG: chemotaxis protein CheX [Bryobacterales bacterium]|nr:chemotaxis protein CheX [Bryobacterales bacterium]
MPHSASDAAANLSQTLRDITAEVLETMFYLFPEEEQAEDGPQSEAPITSAFRFEGEPSGLVVISISAAAARTAAANFLALDEEETGMEKVAEVVCEMANMVGGCLLGCIENTTPLQPFPPEVVAAATLEGRQPVASHLFYLEHGSLRVTLYWE